MDKDDIRAREDTIWGKIKYLYSSGCDFCFSAAINIYRAGCGISVTAAIVLVMILLFGSTMDRCNYDVRKDSEHLKNCCGCYKCYKTYRCVKPPPHVHKSLE